MIDHILGRPSATVRRSQIFLVLFFFLWRLYKGRGPPINSLDGPFTARIPRRVRRRTWLWRLWIGFAGRSRGWKWVGKLNAKLRACCHACNLSRHLTRRTLEPVSADPGNIDGNVRYPPFRRSDRLWT